MEIKSTLAIAANAWRDTLLLMEIFWFWIQIFMQTGIWHWEDAFCQEICLIILWFNRHNLKTRNKSAGLYFQINVVGWSNGGLIEQPPPSQDTLYIYDVPHVVGMCRIRNIQWRRRFCHISSQFLHIAFRQASDLPRCLAPIMHCKGRIWIFMRKCVLLWVVCLKECQNGVTFAGIIQAK